MMKDIDILMMDGCTKTEAEKHLKNGSIVLDGEDFKNHFDDYMSEWDIGEEDQEAYRNMLNNHKPAQDWGVVDHNGATYFIMYVL